MSIAPTTGSGFTTVGGPATSVNTNVTLPQVGGYTLNLTATASGACGTAVMEYRLVVRPNPDDGKTSRFKGTVRADSFNEQLAEFGAIPTIPGRNILMHLYGYMPTPPAVCRYATSPGVSFEAMGPSNVFLGRIGAIDQDRILRNLPLRQPPQAGQTPNPHTYYVRCIQAFDSSPFPSANLDDYVLQFYNTPDLTPPNLSNGRVNSVSGNPTPASLPTNTTNPATFSFTTDDISTCRYSADVDMAYSAMPNQVSDDGNEGNATSHSTLISISGVSPGTTKTYYFRCDNGDSQSPVGYPISFVLVNPISVSITPDHHDFGPNQTKTFTATVTGDSSNQGVTWTWSGTNGGSFSPNGTQLSYTSPGFLSSFTPITVTATSVADPSKSATAQINFVQTDVSISVNGVRDDGSNVKQYLRTPPSCTNSCSYTPVKYDMTVSVSGGTSLRTTVSNNGFAPFSHLTNLSITSTRGTCSIVPGSGFSCDLGDVPPGTVTITLRGTPTGFLPPPEVGLTLSASVLSQSYETITTNNTDSDTIAPPYGAQLFLDKSVTATSVPPVAPGDRFTYSFRITNQGAFAAHSVSIDDLLPTGLQYVSSPDGYSVTTSPGPGGRQRVVMQIGDMTDPSGATANLTARLVVSATQLGCYSNQATASSPDDDPNNSNHTSNAIDYGTCVGTDLLSLTKTGPATATAGTSMNYTLTVRNVSGTSAASNIQVVDSLPAGVTFVSASAGCSNAAGQVTCSIANLAAGAQQALTITVNAPATVPAPPQIINTAQITANTPNDPDTSNNSAQWTTTIQAPSPTDADLGIAMTGPASALVNSAIDYTLTVTNNSATNGASSIQIVDTLPAGVTFVSASPTCSQAGSQVTCSIASLAAGANTSLTISITAPASVPAPPQITNTATITSSSPNDPNPANNTASVTTTIQSGVGNQPPIVFAGNDKTISMQNPQVDMTDATVGDSDGPPPLAVAWTVDSAPAGQAAFVTFVPQTGINPTVFFPAAGTYVLRLTATDGAGASAFDTVTVTVDPFVPPVNQAPQVNAGADKSITLPVNQVDLNDSAVTDDGLPTPPTLTYSWTKDSYTGPGAGNVTFTDAAALHPTATFGNPGTYVLRLTADDGALQNSDTLTVTVGIPPAVDATLTADKTSIRYGEIVHLTWTTVNAITATLDDGTGPQPVAFNDAKDVQLFANTTFTLIASNGVDSVTRSVAIAVAPAPYLAKIVIVDPAQKTKTIGLSEIVPLKIKAYSQYNEDMTTQVAQELVWKTDNPAGALNAPSGSQNSFRVASNFQGFQTFTVIVSSVNSLGQLVQDQATITVINAPSATGDICAAHAYPVPWKSTMGVDKITFTNLAPGTTVKIFSAEARMIREMSSIAGEDVFWNMKNDDGHTVASWVYPYLIEHPNGSCPTKKGKLVIIK